LVAAITRTSTRTSAAPPTRLNALLFQEPQQLGLKGRHHLADLVEEHGAAVGRFEQAQLLLVARR
jgi:hypothetical protein